MIWYYIHIPRVCSPGSNIHSPSNMKFITLGFVTRVLTFITLGNIILYVQQITRGPYGPERISGEGANLLWCLRSQWLAVCHKRPSRCFVGCEQRAKKISGVFQVVLLMERFLLEVASLSHYLQGFVHPRWLFGISCINSISYICSTKVLMLWAEQQLGFCQGACRSTFFSNDIIWFRNFWLYKNFPWKNWKLNITLWIKKKNIIFPNLHHFIFLMFSWGDVELLNLLSYIEFSTAKLQQKKAPPPQVLWCCDFSWDFFLLARALLWLLPVQSSIPGYDEAMEDFEQGKVRQCKVRRKSQGAFFWGWAGWTPGWKLMINRTKFPKNYLVLDGILHDFTGVNCPSPFVECIDSTEIFEKRPGDSSLSVLACWGNSNEEKPYPKALWTPTNLWK